MPWWLFPILIALSVLSQGFFSGSELAVVKADKASLRQRAAAGSRFAKFTLKLINKPEWFFSTTIIGTNISNVLTTTLITFFIINTWDERFEFLAIFSIPVTLLFAEMLPKSLYLLHANRVAPMAGGLLWLISYLLSPLVFVLSILGKVLLSRFSVDEKTGLNRGDLDAMVKKSTSSLAMAKQESFIIRRIFNFSEKTVGDVMTPLVKIQALEENIKVDDALEAFAHEEYSKMPVFHNRIVNIIGYVNGLDLVDKPIDHPIKEYVQTVEYVPETKSLEDLFLTFKKLTSPLVIVVDEYGGTVGLITMEDILEELVGEIEDEYDIKDDLFKQIATNRAVVKTSLEIESLKEQLGIDIPFGDYKTLGGYLLSEFGKIPKVGDSTQSQGWTYIIRKSSPRAIEEVEIIGPMIKK